MVGPCGENQDAADNRIRWAAKIRRLELRLPRLNGPMLALSCLKEPVSVPDVPLATHHVYPLRCSRGRYDPTRWHDIEDGNSEDP